MATPQSIKPRELDKLLTVLANPHCRSIIFYLRNTFAEAATVADLTTEVATQASEEEIAIQLHHSTLSRLDSAGIVDCEDRMSVFRCCFASKTDKQQVERVKIVLLLR